MKKNVYTDGNGSSVIHVQGMGDYTPSSEALILHARVKLLENGLYNLINCAECCDSWESFPSAVLDDANDILRDSKLEG